MLDIYQQQIIDRSQHPQFRGVVANATHTATGANLSCGDEIRFEARIEAGSIQEIKHQGRACAVCTASADLLAEHLTDKPLSVIQETKKEGIPAMLGIPLSPVRLKCALLPLETLKSLEEA